MTDRGLTEDSMTRCRRLDLESNGKERRRRRREGEKEREKKMEVTANSRR
jgi:hypothetical protein